MDPTLDRHALVTPLWLPASLIAAALFHYGLGRGGGVAFLAASFGVIFAAFIGHVIVNAVSSTSFTRRETALGLVAYVIALLGFGLAALVQPDPFAKHLLAVGAGFVALFAVVIASTLLKSGVRASFDRFDVIRTFRGNSRE